MCPALWDYQDQILTLLCMTIFQVFEKCYHTFLFSFLKGKYGQILKHGVQNWRQYSGASLNGRSI